MVKMLNSSKLFIIIGSENNINLNKRQVIVWDNNKEIEVYKFTIENEILNLEIISNKIILVCANKILVYNSNSFELIESINTRPNPKGLIAVGYIVRNILAYPNIDLEHGKLIIKNYDTQNNIFLIMLKMIYLYFH